MIYLLSGVVIIILISLIIVQRIGYNLAYSQVKDQHKEHLKQINKHLDSIQRICSDGDTVRAIKELIGGISRVL